MARASGAAEGTANRREAVCRARISAQSRSISWNCPWGGGDTLVGSSQTDLWWHQGSRLVLELRRIPSGLDSDVPSPSSPV